ncbi:MAG TPA: hypothetical protein VFN26_11505 [Candidatus Acidoferrum sp.]|nr:hypothetical protein [Candidatus Acidoferrum sp.]
MNPESETTGSTTVSAPAAPHCQHRTASGRHCRMAVSDPASGLCFKHGLQLKKDLNVAAKLIGDTEEFTSALTINYSLGELYKLLARDEIHPRRAAVMAYTCNLLLRTLPAIAQEKDSEPLQIILDIPRPNRD